MFVCAYLCVRMGEHEVCAAEESKKKMNEETYFYLVQIPVKKQDNKCRCMFMQISKNHIYQLLLKKSDIAERFISLTACFQVWWLPFGNQLKLQCLRTGEALLLLGL